MQMRDPALSRVPDAAGTFAELLENGAVGAHPAGDAASFGVARRFGSLQTQNESGSHRHSGTHPHYLKNTNHCYRCYSNAT